MDCEDNVGLLWGGQYLSGGNLTGDFTRDLTILKTQSDTTFCTKTYRSSLCCPGLAVGKDEVLQSGDVPLPMAGSCLVSIPSPNPTKYQRAILIGGTYQQSSVTPPGLNLLLDESLMYLEKSSSDIFYLDFKKDLKSFHWTRKATMKLETPVAYGSAVYMKKKNLVLHLGKPSLFGLVFHTQISHRGIKYGDRRKTSNPIDYHTSSNWSC